MDPHANDMAQAAAAAVLKHQEAATRSAMMEDDGNESDGLNEFGLPRNPPRTPPGPAPEGQPMFIPSTDEDELSDEGEIPAVGPHTPPGPAPLTPPGATEARAKPEPRPSPYARSASRGGHRPRRSEPVQKTVLVGKDIPRALTFPGNVMNRARGLLEYAEQNGLTITDEELLTRVTEAIELDRAADQILKKRTEMAKQVEDMAEKELAKIKRIHSKMPRHMQDVVKIEGRTVTIAQEPPMMRQGPPAPFMGMPPPGMFPPGMAPPPGMFPPGMGPPPFGMPPMPMGGPGMGPPPSMGPPPMGGPPMGLSGPPPPFPMPPASLLGPAPFHAGPPPAIGNMLQPPPLLPSSLNAPPPAVVPSPAKKPAIDLSGMITSALKAQVSQTQSSLGTASSSTSTPVKKAVPSLMSINIPGMSKGPGAAKK
ncbi:unnamed protein product [Caenorhabditis brenneri]